MHFTKGVVSLGAALITIAAAATGTCVLLSGAQQSSPDQSSSEQADKYTWLEDIHGEKPMEWVKAEDARTAAVIEKQKAFAQLQTDALQVLDSPDKLAFPVFRGGLVYNTWRDK